MLYRQKIVTMMLKRSFDLILVLLSAPLWLSLMAVVALLVRLKLGTPVFFRQKRPGLNGQIFELIKFRTMLDATDANGRPLPDSERLTPFGRKLRSTSLDELPEMINVLRGEMSLVGPRPLLVQYLERYSPRQARRHEVRPGLTGLAQVRGRNALSWVEKFEYDVYYVDHHSIWLDFKILWWTALAVVVRTGIHSPGNATMPEFFGESSLNRRTGRAKDTGSN